ASRKPRAVHRIFPGRAHGRIRAARAQDLHLPPELPRSILSDASSRDRPLRLFPRAREPREKALGDGDIPGLTLRDRLREREPVGGLRRDLRVLLSPSKRPEKRTPTKARIHARLCVFRKT